MGTVALAEDQTGVSPSPKKDQIIAEFREATWDLTFAAEDGQASRGSNASSVTQIQMDTVNALQEAGYSAYAVNPESFSAVEEELCTDLGAAGLDPQYSYIILIEGEGNPEAATRSAVSDSFIHYYNGQAYTLRWLTVYGVDDPRLAKASQYDLINGSSNRDLIINAIDTLLSAYLSKISPAAINFGTIASLLGVTIENFAPAQSATFTFHAATDWTQRFAQVWNSYDGAWQYGSCVEEVQLNSSISGYYYSSTTLDYVRVNKEFPEEHRYSSHFYDFQWRQDYAVRGYLYTETNWDITGDAEYRHGDKVIITHRHDF